MEEIKNVEEVKIEEKKKGGFKKPLLIGLGLLGLAVAGIVAVTKGKGDQENSQDSNVVDITDYTEVQPNESTVESEE